MQLNIRASLDELKQGMRLADGRRDVVVGLYGDYKGMQFAMINTCVVG